MRLSILLAVAHVLCVLAEVCGQGFVIRDTQQPSPAFVIKERTKETPRAVRRKVVVYSLPFSQCPHCQALYNSVGDGDDEIEVEWVKQNHPRWFTNLGIAPVIYDPYQNVRYDGAMTLAQLKRWANVHLPKTETVTVFKPATEPVKPQQSSGQYVWTQVCRWVQRGRRMYQQCSWEWRESK